MNSTAIIWCEGAFMTPYGKTAHGLVRFTRRYDVSAVIDSTAAGRDAREALDGIATGIPIVASLASALEFGPAQALVIGLAPDGGRLSEAGLAVVRQAIASGLNIVSGMHDFLSENAELVTLASEHGVTLTDVRKTPPRSLLHGFTGRINTVKAPRIALLGTDSAVGKRTTAWLLADALTAAGVRTSFIGTGQTAWLQGAEYTMLLDATINDFVAGELENACLRCWDEQAPDAMVVEGQGSLLNPAYPGGLEILAATRATSIVLQHAPNRQVYDGFDDFPLEPIEMQIAALHAVSSARVVAITLNHEGLSAAQIEEHCIDLQRRTGLAVVDPLIHGVQPVVAAIASHYGWTV